MARTPQETKTLVASGLPHYYMITELLNRKRKKLTYFLFQSKCGMKMKKKKKKKSSQRVHCGIIEHSFLTAAALC